MKLSLDNAFREHQVHKDSGVRWIGKIPSHWKVLPLKYCVSIRITDGPHETPEFIPEGIPFISAEAIKKNKIDFEKRRGFISEELDLMYSKKCKPKKGDVFLVKSGNTTGNAAIVETEMNFNIWSPLALIRANNDIVLPDYILYCIISTSFQDSVSLFSSVGTQPNIGMDVIEDLKLTVPPIDEQFAIVGFLKSKVKQIDDLIEQKEKLLQLLTEKRTAIITQAVTKGLDPKAKMKDSGIEWLGEVPEDWKCSKLRFTTSYIGSGKTPKGGSQVYLDEGIMLLRSQNIHDDGLQLDDVVFINEEMDNELRNSRIQPFDVLLNITGASLGRSFFIPAQFPAANVNQHVCIIRARKDLIHFRFLHFFLTSAIGRSQVESYENGSSREGLNFQQIANMFICLPSKEEQLRIVNYLSEYISKIDNTIQDIEKSVSHLSEYRSSLINSAVTGTIDVRKEKVA